MARAKVVPKRGKLASLAEASAKDLSNELVEAEIEIQLETTLEMVQNNDQHQETPTETVDVTLDTPPSPKANGTSTFEPDILTTDDNSPEQNPDVGVSLLDLVDTDDTLIKR